MRIQWAEVVLEIAALIDVELHLAPRPGGGPRVRMEACYKGMNTSPNAQHCRARASPTRCA